MKVAFLFAGLLRDVNHDLFRISLSILTKDLDIPSLNKKLSCHPPMAGMDLVKEITIKKAYKWNKENRVLVIKTRDNVRWSDGKPYSAYDVEFTFNLKKKFPALDGTGNWNYLKSVTAVDSNHVEFIFSRIDSEF